MNTNILPNAAKAAEVLTLLSRKKTLSLPEIITHFTNDPLQTGLPEVVIEELKDSGYIAGTNAELFITKTGVEYLYTEKVQEDQKLFDDFKDVEKNSDARKKWAAAREVREGFTNEVQPQRADVGGGAKTSR